MQRYFPVKVTGRLLGKILYFIPVFSHKTLIFTKSENTIIFCRKFEEESCIYKTAVCILLSETEDGEFFCAFTIENTSNFIHDMM